MREWDEALAQIAEGAVHRVLVLGAVDAGKSTFCHLLLRAAARHGRAAALIDTDVGQKMVGPPAAVTGADGGAPEVLTGLAFVGTTDPAQGFAPIVGGLERLRRTSSADLLVVNTSGLLRGSGRRLKAAKIAVLEPDLLVTIGDDPDLDLVVTARAARPRLHLPSSPEARRKTPGQRRAARRDAFRRYLDGSPIHAMALAQAKLEALSPRQVVGLMDFEGRDLALGLVEAIDPLSGVVEVRSPVQPEAVAGLVPGRLLLDADCNPHPLSSAGRASCPGRTRG